MSTQTASHTTRPAGRAIRFATTFVVVLVAGIAAIVSYRHGLEVVHMAGETGWVAMLVPGSADGVIFSASMVILSAAKSGVRVPWLAKAGLAFGIAATLAMNVAAGWQHGVPGALVSALPAVALVVAYEMLMGLVRSGRASQPATPSPTTGSQPAAPIVPVLPHVPQTAEEAARLAFEASVRDGEPLSIRALADRYSQSRPRMGALVERVAREAFEASVLDGQPLTADDLTSQYGLSVERADRIVADQPDPAPVGEWEAG